MSQFGQTDEYPQLGLILFWIANLAFYGFGEETGWRGFALPRLQQTHSALVASLVLSVFWALWHVPLFLSLPNLMNMGIGGMIGWVLFIVTGSILLTWMYNSTRGSILILAVFHGTLDIVINSPSHGALATVMGMLFTVLGVLVLLVRGLLPFRALASRPSGRENLAKEERLTTRRPRDDLAETLQPVRDRAVAFAAAWPIRDTHRAAHPIAPA
jgi:hypothetical protein